MSQLLTADPSARIREAHTKAFRESGGGKGQRREITIIEAGWGSSGYYSEALLERDIPRIFPVNTHMYLNHPTESEDRERPERNVLDLVGYLAEAPRMAGIASVSVAHIFEHWIPVLDEIYEHIGLSIRAFGVAEQGDAGGRSGPIIQTLTEGLSIDYVTLAGAGGSVGPLVESVRERAIPLIESARQKQTPEQVKEAQLSELNENLEKAGEERFGSKEPYTYCYVEDVEIDQNWVVFRVRKESEDARYLKVPFVRNADGDVVLGDGAVEVEREIHWEPVSEEELVEESAPADLPKETQMDEETRRRLSELEESVSELKGQVEEAETKKKEAEDRAERAEEALVAVEARKVVAEVLSEDGVKDKLPEKAAQRVEENTLRQKLPTLENGKLDKDTLKERARKELTAEVEYISETSGIGKPRDLGGSEPLSESGKEEGVNRLQKSFEESGMSKEAAELAARGR